jgi:hypothetical protein
MPVARYIQRQPVASISSQLLLEQSSKIGFVEDGFGILVLDLQQQLINQSVR